jgi:homoserine dehydrogenase
VVSSLTVLKFGSSVLPTEDHLPIAVREIQHWVSRGHRVIAVVSALGDATDRLLAHANRYATDRPADESATAALLATGEANTVALLGLALARAGTPASVLDAAAIGLRTEGPLLDSRAVDLDRGAVHRALSRRPVIVVPGFLGRDEHGQTTLLGRGGSDLTALFLAGELFAEQCVLLKDVDGLYDRDPSEDPAGARRYLRANYDDVLRLTGGIVQHKAVRYARDRRTQFTVASCGRFDGTLIWGGDTVIDPDPTEPTPTPTATSTPTTTPMSTPTTTAASNPAAQEARR